MNQVTHLVSRRAALGAAIATSLNSWQHQTFAQAPFDTARTTDVITAETKQAIDRGLAWLSRRQVVSGREEGAFGHGGYAGGVAVGSLGGLAFMMSGSPPGQGPFGKSIDRCIRFITSCTDDSGYIAVPGGGQDNMYGHGFG